MGVLNEVLRLPCRQAGKRVQPASESPEGVYQLLPRLPAEAVAEVGLWGADMTDWETVERLAAELCHMAGGDWSKKRTKKNLWRARVLKLLEMVK